MRRAKERLEAENEKKKVQILRSEKDLAEEGVVLQHPNTEEGNDTEDVEMSDSMPPTPAVVLTEA